MHPAIRIVATSAILCLLGGCMDSPPKIARGLPKNLEQARIAFDQRVRERFPVGSDEKVLRETLLRERFKFASRGEHSATYEAEQLVCRTTWVVTWGAESERITHIAGDRRSVCL
jgi:hypothetical protein